MITNLSRGHTQCARGWMRHANNAHTWMRAISRPTSYTPPASRWPKYVMFGQRAIPDNVTMEAWIEVFLPSIADSLHSRSTEGVYRASTFPGLAKYRCIEPIDIRGSPHVHDNFFPSTIQTFASVGNRIGSERSVEINTWDACSTWIAHLHRHPLHHRNK